MPTAFEPLCFSVSGGLVGRFVRPLRLAAVAWLAVFTVLVCAVVPAGLPQTVTQGSAFNPATTAVALQARGPQARSLVKRLIKPDRGDAPIAVVKSSALLRVATPVISPAAHVGHSRIAIESDPRGRIALEALPWARGPPAA